MERHINAGAPIFVIIGPMKRVIYFKNYRAILKKKSKKLGVALFFIFSFCVTSDHFNAR